MDLMCAEGFESFFAGCCWAAQILCASIASNDKDIEIAYGESLWPVLQMAAGLVLWSRSCPKEHVPLDRDSVIGLGRESGISIFGVMPPADAAPEILDAAFAALIRSFKTDMTEHWGICLPALPIDWLGHAYERMLSLRPMRAEQDMVAIRRPKASAGLPWQWHRAIEAPAGEVLQRVEQGEVYLSPESSERRRRGAYFTPRFLVDYIVSASAGLLLQQGKDAASLSVLDPAMGSGEFLMGVLEYLSRSSGMEPGRLAREKIAAGTLCGIDSDPLSVHLARFALAVAADLDRDYASMLDRFLILADTLALDRMAWESSFPGRIPPGFDAVIGNPPYVAAKTGFISYKRPTDPAGRISCSDGRASKMGGQRDIYLEFLYSVVENGLVAPNGILAMVLPDPLLIRGNAALIRRKLFGEWETVSLLHLAAAFAEAGVANVVPVWRNRRSISAEFPVCRIERGKRVKTLMMGNRLFLGAGTGCEAGNLFAASHRMRIDLIRARPRAEVTYLLSEDRYRMITDGLQKPNGRLREGFVPLGDIAEWIFRGEEVGKKAIPGRSGRFPMLLGGQSIQPYRVIWEGHYIDELRKGEDIYRGTKILVQKSAPRLVAAIDTEERAFPQSVYGIRLGPDAPDPFFILALLNCTVLSDYLFAVSTGYKLLQPQIELKDLRALPVPIIHSVTPKEERERIARCAVEEPNRALGLASVPDLASEVLSALARRVTEILGRNANAAEAVTLRRAIDDVAELLLLSHSA